jgi:hypothetical protein
MKKKKYITPCVQLEQLAIETHLAAGSFQSDEAGAKSGNVFDEEFDVDEDYEYEIPLL